MTDIIKRYVTNLRREADNADYSYYCGTLAGGRWDDIDYDQKSVADWDSLTHLKRLRAITAGGAERTEKDKLLEALDFWLENDFINPNWWYNQIGVPGLLADVCLLLNDCLEGERRAKAAAIIGRGSLRLNPEISGWTGANLIWGAEGTVRDALFMNDEALLARAVTRAAEEISETTGLNEGIKSDRSFYQHGAQLYSGGYGRAFTGSVASLAHLLGGSGYQFPVDKLELFCDFVLRGQRYFTRRNAVDYLCVGRELARKGALSAMPFRGSALKMLDTPEMPRKGELRDWLAQLDGQAALRDTRWFRDSYILCHHREGFYMSAKGSRSNFIGTESGNGENYLGYNLSFGSNTCFMSDGREYFDIAPVWDYSMLPGTTSYMEDDDALLRRTGGYGRWYAAKGTDDRCGGLSDGRRGVIYTGADHDGLRGMFGFFFFDFGMIALGAGITCVDPENNKEIVTTVNQCFSDNPADNYSNGAFSYHNLCDKPLTVFCGETEGSWKRNNIAESDEPVKRDIYKLYYSHGSQPAGSYYAYAVCARDAAPPPVRIINNDALQAVETETGFAAVFHKPGEYKTAPGKTVSSSGGICII